MTEFNQFSASQEPSADTPEQAEQTESTGEGSRKTVIALGALAGLVIAGGAFFFLGGEDDTDDFAPVAKAPRAAAAPAPTAAPQVKVPAQSRATLGRNPFRALYVEPVAAAAAAPAAKPDSPVSNTTPIIVTQPAPVAPGGAAAPAPDGQPQAQPAPAQAAPAPAQNTVSLKSVTPGKDGAEPTGTFVFNGKTVTGAPGEVMDGKLLVISLQQDQTGGWFANLQFGDGSPFEVHERQTVVVQ